MDQSFFLLFGLSMVFKVFLVKHNVVLTSLEINDVYPDSSETQ